MSHWELTYNQYPTKLAPTTEDAHNIPIIFPNWFITHNKGDRVRFTQFGDKAVWNVNPNSPWIYLQTNLAVPQETLEAALPYYNQLTDLDIYTGLANHNGKIVTWHQPTQTWKYHNNRIVHFNQTPTKGTNSALNSEEETSEASSDEKSDPDEDTAQVENLLRQAKTTVTLAIQKLSSQAGTPDPTDSPLPKASLLLGKSKLSTAEVSQTATPPVSKGKTPAPPPPRMSASSSSLRPIQTMALSSTTKPLAPPSRKPKGTTPPTKPNPPASTLKLPLQPPGGNPPAPPPAAPMAQPNPPPCILGTAPESYNRKGDMAIAFWNSLENYFTVNATTFDTNTKKVSSALTYFKQGTQARDWASDHIATILARNPVNYGTWDDFKDAFKDQFIPLETQNEAIQNIHNTPQRNWEFGEWYQEWSKYARQVNVDEATQMYAFRRALDTALHNKLLQLSPMPTTLARLVEKAREFDKNWCTFAGPTRGFQQQNPRIWEILEEESEINAFPRPSPFGQNQGQGRRRGRGHGRGWGRLTPEECKRCIDNHLCLYCGIPRHIAINCTALPNSRPGSSFQPQSSRPSVQQIDSIPEEGMEKLSLEDESEINIASVNQFEPLVKLNLDENLSFLGTL